VKDIIYMNIYIFTHIHIYMYICMYTGGVEDGAFWLGMQRQMVERTLIVDKGLYSSSPSAALLGILLCNCTYEYIYISLAVLVQPTCCPEQCFAMSYI